MIKELDLDALLEVLLLTRHVSDGRVGSGFVELDMARDGRSLTVRMWPCAMRWRVEVEHAGRAKLMPNEWFVRAWRGETLERAMGAMFNRAQRFINNA